MKTIVILISTILMSSGAQASFLDRCTFDMKVTDLSVSTMRLQSQKPFTRKVTATVIKAKDGGGHTPCDHHVGQSYQMDLESVALADLAILNTNHRISVLYFHINSLSPNGVFQSTTYTLQTPAQQAYNSARNNPEVQDKIQDLMETLDYMVDEPVVELQATVQGLDESFCGFAGCDSVYLVTMTYGEDYQNSNRETIVIARFCKS